MSRCHAPRADHTRCRNRGIAATHGFYCARHASRVGIKNLSTADARAFWAGAEASARVVVKWPAWKQTGISVAQTRSEPRR